MRRGWSNLSQAGVKIREERSHLFIIEAAGKCGHHSLALQNHAPDFSVGRGSATGQPGQVKEMMQIRRSLLQCKVVVFMTMGAPAEIELFPG